MTNPPARRTDNIMAIATEVIEKSEFDIISHLDLYLITWTPDPKKLPCKYNMVKNYDYHIRLFFKNFNKACHTFAICPEFNLNGNIHYHGWFQLKDPVKWYKSVLPALKHNGYTKINLSTNHKLFNFDKKDNSLWYYKKDLYNNAQVFNRVYCYNHLSEKPKVQKKKQYVIPDYLSVEQETRDMEQQIADLLKINF